MEHNGNPNREPVIRPDQLLICLDDLYRELENQTLIDKLIKENPNADREEICRSLIKQTYYSTKEAVGNILAHNPQIASGPPDSDNQVVYLMNARIWCIELIRKQKAGKKPAETERKGKRGRHKKYTSAMAKQMHDMYEQHYEKNNDSKGSWGEVAKFFGIKSGKAAEMACRRYLHKQNK